MLDYLNARNVVLGLIAEAVEEGLPDHFFFFLGIGATST